MQPRPIKAVFCPHRRSFVRTIATHANDRNNPMATPKSTGFSLSAGVFPLNQADVEPPMQRSFITEVAFISKRHAIAPSRPRKLKGRKGISSSPEAFRCRSANRGGPGENRAMPKRFPAGGQPFRSSLRTCKRGDADIATDSATSTAHKAHEHAPRLPACRRVPSEQDSWDQRR